MYNPGLYCYYYTWYKNIAQETFQENGVAGLYGVVTVQWLLVTLYGAIYTIAMGAS